VSFIDLNRHFYEWTGDEIPDPDAYFSLQDKGIDWTQLLTKRRIVVLAEAGSWKTTEFDERARILSASNRYVFSASVQDVGRDGLVSALSVDKQQDFADWLRSTDEAWFFVDSVDEAKDQGIWFEQAARKLGQLLHGGEDRCYMVFSCRFTDWGYKRDLESLKKLLPISSIVSKSAPTADEELLRLIRNERPQPNVPNEEPFVVLMAPLDTGRIRCYAEQSGAPQVDHLLRAIADSNLWRFARRPLDLSWLVSFWRDEKRLGSLSEMISRSITERLKETNPQRQRTDSLNGEHAQHAVERIGAAMVFGRRHTIALPNHQLGLTPDGSLDLADVLSDWSSDDRVRLLNRPIFDPATHYRIRFHNDNEGAVSGFLAAHWLTRLRKANLSTTALLRLLFADSYGLHVLRPSLSETAAWLCLSEDAVAQKVLEVAPELLLTAGDPASLSVGIREKALGTC
jgi:hypothetical protein